MLKNLLKKGVINLSSRTPIVRDRIRREFEFECENGTLNLLYEAIEPTNAAGTFSITALESCDGIRIYINGDLVNTLEEGETVIYTASPLETIEVECRTSPCVEGTCRVSLFLIVHYELN